VLSTCAKGGGDKDKPNGTVADSRADSMEIRPAFLIREDHFTVDDGRATCHTSRAQSA
jgi:hypothetical protein